MKAEERERVRAVRSRDEVCRSVDIGSKTREVMDVECWVRGWGSKRGGVEKVGERDQRLMRPRESAVKSVNCSSSSVLLSVGEEEGESEVGMWE